MTLCPYVGFLDTNVIDSLIMNSAASPFTFLIHFLPAVLVLFIYP